MADILSNQDKVEIANAHKRQIEMNKWNLELSLVEENAISTPNTEVIANLNAQLADTTARLAAINEEIASLTE